MFCSIIKILYLIIFVGNLTLFHILHALIVPDEIHMVHLMHLFYFFILFFFLFFCGDD